MAYYAVVDDFRTGMPQTVLVGGLKPRGIACHSTEGGDGEARALGTIKFLIDRPDRNASYHEVWYAKQDGFEARRIVRPDRAAHSMNPAQPPWNPNERVRRILGDKWFDPNAFSYAVSIAGTTRTTVPTLIASNPGFMAGARRRISEIKLAFPSLNADPLFNHGEGQADRSDWGPLMRPALEDDVNLPLRFQPVEWNVKSGAPFWTGGPGTGEQKFFAADQTIDSTVRSTDGQWVIVRVIDEEVWMKRADLTPTKPGGDDAYAAAVRKVIEEGAKAIGDAACRAELASAQATIETQSGIIAEQKTRISAVKAALG